MLCLIGSGYAFLLESGFWKAVFGKRFLENSFWKTVFVLENSIQKPALTYNEDNLGAN